MKKNLKSDLFYYFYDYFSQSSQLHSNLVKTPVILKVELESGANEALGHFFLQKIDKKIY